jgi:hypothetical protein
MEFFAIITLQLAGDSGVMQVTVIRTVTTDLSAKRADIYNHMRSEAASAYGDRWSSGVVVFFSAEPNGLSLADALTP